MPQQEQQRIVFEHVRLLAKRLEKIGLDDLAGCRREYAGYAIDPGLPRGVTVHGCRIAGVPCVWFVPHNGVPGRVAVHALGGGFMLGSAASHKGMLGRLALAMRSRVLLPLYRLAPENRFPSALEDVFSVYSDVVRSGSKSSESKSSDEVSRKYFLTGDSCGGGIAIAVAVMARDVGTRLPDGVVALGAFADLTASGNSYEECAASDPIVSRELALASADAYLGDIDRRDPRASPLFADLSGLPPLLLQASTTESLRDDSTRLAENARRAGVLAELQLWPDMVHVWHHFAPFLPQATDAIAKVGEFVDSIAEARA